MTNGGFTGRHCAGKDTDLPVKDLWLSSNFFSSFVLYHSHISQFTEKNTVGACARGGGRGGALTGKALQHRYVWQKQQFMDDHQRPALMFYIPLWIDFHLEVRLYTRSPSAFCISHAKLPTAPQTERARRPAPPSCVSTGKGSAWEPSGKSPTVHARYRAKTSPAFHALTVDGSHKEGKPHSSESKANVESTQGWIYLCSSWIRAA